MPDPRQILLRDIIGEKPLPAAEAVEKVMEYCRKHGLITDKNQIAYTKVTYEPRKILHHYNERVITEIELISAMICAVGRGALEEFNEIVKEPLRSKVLKTAREFVANPERGVVIGTVANPKFEEKILKVVIGAVTHPKFEEKILKETQAGAEILTK